jgi:hypothetical protein
MGRIAIPIVYEILTCEAISILCFKLVQGKRTDREVIGSPVGEEIPVSLITSPYPYKVVEEGGKPPDICLRVLLAPANQIGTQIALDLGVPGVQLPKWFDFPVVGYMIVHVYLFPDSESKEVHTVLMKGYATLNGD